MRRPRRDAGSALRLWQNVADLQRDACGASRRPYRNFTDLRTEEVDAFSTFLRLMTFRKDSGKNGWLV